MFLKELVRYKLRLTKSLIKIHFPSQQQQIKKNKKSNNNMESLTLQVDGPTRANICGGGGGLETR